MKTKLIEFMDRGIYVFYILLFAFAVGMLTFDESPIWLFFSWLSVDSMRHLANYKHIKKKEK